MPEAHTLTDVQQQYVKQINEEHQALYKKYLEPLQIRLNWFLSYVVDEAQLPKNEKGYRLSDDQTQLIPND